MRENLWREKEEGPLKVKQGNGSLVKDSSGVEERGRWPVRVRERREVQVSAHEGGG